MTLCSYFLNIIIERKNAFPTGVLTVYFQLQLRDKRPDNYDKYSVSCSGPQRLANKRWSHVDMDQFACQPVIQYPGRNSTLELNNDSLTVGCKVHGDPMPAVQWMFNGQTISNHSRRDYNFTVNNTAFQDNVMWTNLTASEFRPTGKSEFECIVKNAAGWDGRKITVIVKVSFMLTKKISREK